MHEQAFRTHYDEMIQEGRVAELPSDGLRKYVNFPPRRSNNPQYKEMEDAWRQAARETLDRRKEATRLKREQEKAEREAARKKGLRKFLPW